MKPPQKAMTRAVLRKLAFIFAAHTGDRARRVLDDRDTFPAREPRAHMLVLIGCPIAFQPECPLFMYLASNPASRSLIAVLQPTWKP